MKEFSEHGTYRIKVDNNILMVNAKGPFNIETVNRYHNEVLESVEQLAESGSPWGQVIVLHEESLFTHEASNQLMESNRLRKTKGLSHCAVVLVQPVGIKLIKKQMTGIYRDAGIEMQIFEKIEAAKQWLMQCAVSEAT